MNLKNIYYPKLIKIPTPQYIVLYNGTDRKIGESITLKLSDAFEDNNKPEGYIGVYGGFMGIILTTFSIINPPD